MVEGKSRTGRNGPLNADVKERSDGATPAVDGAEGYEDVAQHARVRGPRCAVGVYFLDKFGLPDESPALPRLHGHSPSMAAAALGQLARLPLEAVHHYALNGEFVQSLLADRRMADLMVHVGGRHFFAHRVIVSGHSQVLASQLSADDVTAATVTDVTLTGVDAGLFKAFLYFCYTGEIHIDSSNVGPVLHMARALDSNTLGARVAVYLSTHEPMPLSQALSTLVQHREGVNAPLAEAALVRQFQAVVDAPQLLAPLPVTSLTRVLTSDQLCVTSEMEVFWAVLMWVASDVGARTKYLDELMELVRFNTMSPTELLDCARATEMVQKSPKCRSFLVNGSWVANTKQTGVKDPLSLPQQPPRSCGHMVPGYRSTVAGLDKKFMQYNKLLTQSAHKEQVKKKGATETGLTDGLAGDEHAYSWESDQVLLERSVSIHQTESSSRSGQSSKYDIDNNAIFYERSIFIQQKQSRLESFGKRKINQKKKISNENISSDNLALKRNKLRYDKQTKDKQENKEKMPVENETSDTSLELLCLNPFFDNEFEEKDKLLLEYNEQCLEETESTDYPQTAETNHTRLLSPITIKSIEDHTISQDIELLRNRKEAHIRNVSHSNSVAIESKTQSETLYRENKSDITRNNESSTYKDIETVSQINQCNLTTSQFCHKQKFQKTTHTSEQSITDNDFTLDEYVCGKNKQETALKLWESNPLETRESVLRSSILVPIRSMKVKSLSRAKNEASVRFSEEVKYQQ